MAVKLFNVLFNMVICVGVVYFSVSLLYIEYIADGSDISDHSFQHYMIRLPIRFARSLYISVTQRSYIGYVDQGWGQFRNWNWNWYQFQFQFQELELQRNWIKGIGIGIGIDKEELKELIQFLFLIVNSFWFFAMFLAEHLINLISNPFEYNWQEYH